MDFSAKLQNRPRICNKGLPRALKKGCLEKHCMEKGYLTVFITLTLTAVLSLCLVLIRGIRLSTMALEAECAVDAGMNSVLAEYHRELFEQYDLLFVDTSYGTSVPSYENTQDHLEEYVRRNLGQEETLLALVSGDLLGLKLEQAQILGLTLASDNGGESLRGQIADIMYEKAGLPYFEKLTGWLEVLEEKKLQENTWLSQAEDARQQLQEWTKEAQKKYPDKNMEVDGWFSRILLILRSGILNLTTNVWELSRQGIRAENYLSHREERLTGTGESDPQAGEGKSRDAWESDLPEAWESNGSEKSAQAGGVWEQFLLQAYILDKTGRFGAEKENSLLRYQTEYILMGKEKDVDNLRAVAEAIFVIREGANALHIIGCDDKMALITELSDGLAAAIMLPEASPVFRVLVVGAWAGLESVYDLRQLLAGKELPLIKTEEQWFFGLGVSAKIQDAEDLTGHLRETREGDASLQAADSGQDSGRESPWQVDMLGYSDYLSMLLMLQDSQTATYRLMDIMEMDIRLTPGNEWFRMDGCVDCLEVRFDMTGGDGYNFEITRKYGY